jgi:hypothetical protein
MFTRYPPYQVLICCEHRCAVYGLDKHLERHHTMPIPGRQLHSALSRVFLGTRYTHFVM